MKQRLQIQTEGDRIRAAAAVMRSRGLPEVASRYETLALSHDLKDERDARTQSKSELAIARKTPPRIKP